MNFSWVLNRLKEPSTFAGLAAILGGASIFGLSTETWTEVLGAFTAIAGAVAAVTADR